MEPTTEVKMGLIERSPEIIELTKAWVKFQGSIENVKKEAENPFYKSAYATIGNIIDSIRKPLSDAGLSFAQFPVEKNKLVTMIMHTSGQYFQSTVEFNLKDTTPQTLGSAITYMRRYSLSAILGIATEDDDGNEASSPSKPTTTTVKPKTETAEEQFSKAVIAIEKYTTVAQCEAALEKVDKSKAFTDEQKNKLETLISGKIDLLTSDMPQ